MNPRTTKELPVNQMLNREMQLVRASLWPFLATMAALLGFYTMSIYVQAGWTTYFLGGVPMLIIAITALARVNDITPEQTSARWNIRRIGLILAGAGAISILCEPLMAFYTPTSVPDWALLDFPSWREVMLRWGVALTWMTTPHMPPYWNYITGRYKTLREAKLASLSPIMTGLMPEKAGDESPQYAQEDLVKRCPRGKERRSGVDRRQQ